jgi:predicted DNA-binding transcriptional regulator YafY
MRADRLLSILLLLQTHPRLTARNLAERLEVTERTIYRDMEALSMAGIPVIAERGQHGGWSLAAGYRTHLTGLKDSEIQAIFLANPARLLTDLGLSQAAETAFLKLLASLPTMQRTNAEFIQQRIYVDSGGWRQSGEVVTFLPVLQTALWQECQLLLTYQRGDGQCVERQVDPLGLVAKRQTWYLVAQVDCEIRTYRVSRIMAATVLDTPSRRPNNFDLAEYWEQTSAEFMATLPRYSTQLRVAPGMVEHIRLMWRYTWIDPIAPPDADGWQLITVIFELAQEAARFIAGCGAQIEIISPPELREQVIVQAQALLDFYAAH